MARYIDLIKEYERDSTCQLDYIHIIKQVPSAQPRKGKWIDDGTELGCCCSECGTTLDDYFDGSLHKICLSKIPNFCPSCGSYNGGERE